MKKTLWMISCFILITSGSLVKAQSFKNYTTADGLPDNFINGGVAVDSNNNKWFGTVAGVAKYNNSTWTVYKTSNGLIDNYTTCIAVDKNNNIWVGTNSGVSKFNGTSWTSYTTSDGLIDNGVVYIAGDFDGSVWFATSVGVSKLKDTTWTDYTTTDGLPTDVINFIATDTSGNKWFGTQMAGFSKYNNTNFTNISTTIMDSLLDNNIFAIAIDKLGQKWIGTWYGITKLDNSNNWVKNYRLSDGLYNNFIRDIKIDMNNNVWVGMFADYNTDGGISVYNGTKWVSYSVAEGLSDKQVIRLAIDKNNDVWIATGNGVSKLSQATTIDENPTISNHRIYPNPAQGFICIEHEKAIQLKVMDLSGNKVMEGYLSGTDKFDISDLHQGFYILQVIEGNNISNSKFKVY
jgi:ligand-binding sensor domain-containing protein